MRMHGWLGRAVFCGLILSAGPALAYVGPGAGLSAIGSVLSFLGVIVLMIMAFLWYPLKRLMGRLRKTPAAEEDEAQGAK